MRTFTHRILSKFCIISSKLPVIDCKQGKNVLNLTRLDNQNSFLESVVIVNNILNESWLEKSIRACQHVVIADGGANQLYNTPFRDSYKVRSIVGDFDSIQNHVRDFYQKKGVQFHQIIDQNINDFEKALNHSTKNSWQKVFVLGAFGGRMDHALSGMSNTTKLCRKHKDLEVVLIGRENLMYYIRPNIKHEIRISKDIDEKGCGLMRFGEQVKVTTKGLKWNLGPGNQFSSLKWGQFISTSNQIVSETVQIQSEGSLFFVAHFKNSR